MIKAYTKNNHPKSVYLEYGRPWGTCRKRTLIDQNNFLNRHRFDVSKWYLIEKCFTRLPDKPDEVGDVWEFDFEKYEWVKRN